MIEIDCSSCKQWFDHIQRAASARSLYKADVALGNFDILVVSVDLQKVTYY